jgi:tripartite ATP-independent transporter DctM subunit
LSMTDPQVGMLMLGLFIFIIMLGFPIAFTLMAMGVAFGYYAYYTPGQEIFENRIFTLLVQKAFEVTTSDVLTAVPLFLFMGYVVERANILDRLFHSLQLSMKNVPGALAVATLATCAMFATATGIVGAVVTLMGLLALPAMLRAGYDVKLSAGVVCAGGCLGILIPPSILLIVYAATAGVSAVKLYAAAFLPGFLLTGFYMLYVIARAMLNPALCPKLPPEQTNVPFGEVLWALLTSFFPLAILIVSVLGAILFGLATPSEAAGAGALASMVLAAAYGALNFTMLRDSVYLTARATAMVCYLFIGSWTFSAVFAVLGGQQVVESFFLSLNLSTTGFLVLTQIIIFLLGWPLEWTEIIIIFVPIFLPLLDDFQVDSIFFGILVALNTQTAFNTPPVAMAAFYLKGVAPPSVKLTDIFSGALPFVFMVFLTMILVYIFPQIALWLPDYLYRPR